MNLCLIKASRAYQQEITDYMDEWLRSGERIVPASVNKPLLHEDFDAYCASLEVGEGHPTLVPDSTFFCLDRDSGQVVGAVNIRHRLNEGLLYSGGHVGDGVRPSARRKGVASAMIALALEECRKLGIPRVLMTCDKDNIASAKSIQHNGGVLEDERMSEGKLIQRYWIDLE